MNSSTVHHDLVLDSPVGRLGLWLRGDHVAGVDFLHDGVAFSAPVSGFARQVVRAFERYFSDGSQPIELPVAPEGTPYQQRVWNLLAEIPPGETRTYGELALHLDSGARAVGNACRRNPVPIIIPCHRVVSAVDIGGYAGQTGGPVLARKQWLLEHEKPAA